MRKPHKLINEMVPTGVESADTFGLNVTNGETPELQIMEAIGEDFDGKGVTAKGVVDFLGENKGKPINVRINSPGGLVYDGLQIYNGLAAHDAEVTVTIEGLAYSAASFIAMAGDVIKIHDSADIGIHRAAGLAFGNQNVMQDVMDWLSVIDEHLVNIYAERTGKPEEQIEEWLDGKVDGTLFSAREALEAGFVDEVIPLKSKKKPGKKAIARAHASYRARLMSMK